MLSKGFHFLGRSVLIGSSVVFFLTSAAWGQVILDTLNDTSDEDFAITGGIFLEQSDLVRGQPAVFRVSNAQPGETVFFIFSLTGLGMGPIVPQLGGLRLDLLGPARLIGRATVQLDGEAQITRSVPANAPVFDVVWA